MRGNHRMPAPATALVLANHANTSQAMLDRYQWNNRVLLVFAPSEEDPRFCQT